jgi:hypothetical protein
MLFRGKVFLTGKEKPCIIEFDDSQGVPEPGVFVIYGFIDPRTNDVFYVGQTDHFTRRMKSHVTHSTNHAALLAQRLRRIYEAGVHTRVVIFARTDDAQMADVLEYRYIAVHEATVMNRAHNREWRGKIE